MTQGPNAFREVIATDKLGVLTRDEFQSAATIAYQERRSAGG